MIRSRGPNPTDRPRDGRSRAGARGRLLGTFAALAIHAVLIVGGSARAQPPIPQVPDTTERSGLLMRFAGTPTFLPPDPRRDNFYWTRYGDSGRIWHVNWFRSQGLYGLAWKASHTESVYPYWYGSPGQSTIDQNSMPWPRPLRFVQGLVDPFRPVGMYYQMGSYVPVFDLDPIAPGPGPWPFPFYFNWDHGG